MTDLLEMAKRTLAEKTNRAAGRQASETLLPIGLDADNLVNARAVLNRTGVRKFFIAEGLIIGIWSDLDSPEIRAALRMLGDNRLPIKYLDGPEIPMRYKLRDVDGQAPMNVIAAMERSPEPWTVRDQMMVAMNWRKKGISPEQFMAEALTQQFKEYAATRGRGKTDGAPCLDPLPCRHDNLETQPHADEQLDLFDAPPQSSVSGPLQRGPS